MIRPVAGISIGLVGEDGREELLTDILGDEDHYGDMDFKVSGTSNGITGIQLDLKIRGLREDLIAKTLERAKTARFWILGEMAKTIATHRAQISPHAPRLLTLHINPEKIGKIIGPGGKTIKKIVETTGAKIDIEDDGTVYISATGNGSCRPRREEVERLADDVKIGKNLHRQSYVHQGLWRIYRESDSRAGWPVSHFELSDKFVKSVNDEVKIGMTVRVKVISIDDREGRIKLSRRQAHGEERQVPVRPQPRAPVQPASAASRSRSRF